MPHYKDLTGKVHFLRSKKNENMLPAGCIQITDEEAGTIVNPPPTLNDLKADKRRELKAARTAAIEADVAVGARTWPSDDSFKSRLTQLIARIGRGKPAPAKFRGTSGNPINTPTVAQLETIEDAIAAQEEAAWDRYWARIDALQDATNAAQVAAIVW